MLINCDNCGKEFFKRSSRIAESKTSCCSRRCSNILKGSRIIKCEYCKKEIIRGKKYLEKAKYHYCSRECLTKDKAKKNRRKCSYCKQYTYKTEREIKKNKTDLVFCDKKCRHNYFVEKYQVFCIICNRKFYKHKAEQERYPIHCCSTDCRNKYNDRRVKINCKNCDKILYRPPSLLKDKKNIFCSKRCYDEFQDFKIEVKCDKCGKKILKSPSAIERNRHNFCSPECFSKYAFKESFVESQFEDLVKGLGIKYERNTRSIVKPLELDFYFPDIKYAVEVNGICHYKPIYGEKAYKIIKNNERRKKKKCKELGITLRTVKPGDCKYETFMPRYKRVVWEIKKRIKDIDK